MTEVIQYVYYRVARLFRRFSKDKGLMNSNAIVYLSICIILNLYSITCIVLYVFFDITSLDVVFFTNKSEYGSMLSLFFILLIIWFFLFSFIDDDESFYQQLEKKYRDEKHRMLKGLLIICYTIVTILLPFIIGHFTAY